MYVCVCNSIRDRQVRSAVQGGAETVGRVFRAHGCKPECAQCVDCMREVINDEVSASQALYGKD
jgi:bacterioferritin-associated ferredoxin